MKDLCRLRSGELLAGRQGFDREVESEGSRRQGAGPTKQEAHEADTLGEMANIVKALN